MDCQAKLEKDGTLTDDEYIRSVLFETSHSMDPSSEELFEAVQCPRCLGRNCTKSIINHDITHFIRGNGYLDTAGAKRDMNVYKLDHDDPYSQYRQAGEVDELRTNLVKKGKHDPKTKYFTK